MRAWGRGALPIKKMADRLSLQLSRLGWTEICVARGRVSWGSKDDAARELQLWYRESDNSYCINAGQTGYMAVRRVFDVYSSLPKVH